MAYVKLANLSEGVPKLHCSALVRNIGWLNKSVPIFDRIKLGSIYC